MNDNQITRFNIPKSLQEARARPVQSCSIEVKIYFEHAELIFSNGNQAEIFDVDHNDLGVQPVCGISKYQNLSSEREKAVRELYGAISTFICKMED